MSRQFYWPVRIYYEDTDLGGVVYYANYLKYMERARTEWLRSGGFDQDSLIREHNILFVVAEANLKFHKPARFDDLVYVGANIETHRHTDVIFSQPVLLGSQEGETLCAGRIRVACLQADNFRPRPMPVDLLERMQ